MARAALRRARWRAAQLCGLVAHRVALRDGGRDRGARVTCAFCAEAAVASCCAPVDQTWGVKEARALREGDSIRFRDDDDGTLSVTVAHLLGAGQFQNVRVLAKSSRSKYGHFYYLRAEQLVLTFLNEPGPCAKPACDLHHADRGAPGAIACADHWRVS